MEVKIESLVSEKITNLMERAEMTLKDLRSEYGFRESLSEEELNKFLKDYHYVTKIVIDAGNELGRLSLKRDIEKNHTDES